MIISKPPYKKLFQAFTLVELLTTIIVISALVMSGTYSYNKHILRTRISNLLTSTNAAQAYVASQYAETKSFATITYTSNTAGLDFTDITSNTDINTFAITKGEITITGVPARFKNRADVSILLTPIVDTNTNIISTWLCSADTSLFDILPSQCQNVRTSCAGITDSIWNGSACVCRTLSEHVDTGACVPCTGGKVWDTGTSTCVCSTGWYDNAGTCTKCSGNRVYSGGSCSCPADQNWDAANGYCVACQTGMTWNGTACACPAGNYWNGTSCEACATPRTWNATTLVCECPTQSDWQQTPLTWNGTACVCPDPAKPFLDPNTNICRACSTGIGDGFAETATVTNGITTCGCTQANQVWNNNCSYCYGGCYDNRCYIPHQAPGCCYNALRPYYGEDYSGPFVTYFIYDPCSL